MDYILRYKQLCTFTTSELNPTSHHSVVDGFLKKGGGHKIMDACGRD